MNKYLCMLYKNVFNLLKLLININFGYSIEYKYIIIIEFTVLYKDL